MRNPISWLIGAPAPKSERPPSDLDTPNNSDFKKPRRLACGTPYVQAQEAGLDVEWTFVDKDPKQPD
jgi:hypothetical protein